MSLDNILCRIFCLFLNISSSQLIFRRILCRLVCILSGEVEEVSAPLQEGISSVLRRSSSLQNFGVFSNLRFAKIKFFCIFCIVFWGGCQATRLSSILRKDFSTMMFLWHYSPWRKCQMFCENPHPRFFCPALNCFGQMGGKKCSWQESCHRTEGEVASKGWKCVLQLWAMWLHCGI